MSTTWLMHTLAVIEREREYGKGKRSSSFLGFTHAIVDSLYVFKNLNISRDSPPLTRSQEADFVFKKRSNYCNSIDEPLIYLCVVWVIDIINS
jgi:hypothetical protein